jgi:hypothetical protein
MGGGDAAQAAECGKKGEEFHPLHQRWQKQGDARGSAGSAWQEALVNVANHLLWMHARQPRQLGGSDKKQNRCLSVHVNNFTWKGMSNAGRLHDHLVIAAVIGVLLAGSTTTS